MKRKVTACDAKTCESAAKYSVVVTGTVCGAAPPYLWCTKHTKDYLKGRFGIWEHLNREDDSGKPYFSVTIKKIYEEESQDATA